MANYNLGLLEAKRTTLTEFEIYAKMFAIKQVTEMNKLHQQAWLMMQIKATDKKGKSKYRSFDKFFDYDKAYIQALRPGYKEPKILTLADSNMRLQNFLRKGGK